MLLVLFRAYGRFIPRQMLVAISALVLVVGIGVYAVPELGVQARVNQAVEEVVRYAQGDRSYSSVGARFEIGGGRAI